MPEETAKDKGWAKAHREMLDWPWFKKPAVAHFWLYCVLKASHKPHDQLVGHERAHLDRGQFIYGREAAAKETGLSIQQVRTALARLIRSGSLKSTKHSTSLFSVITVCNYEIYQGENNATNQPINQGLTRVQPGSNHKQECIKNGEEEKQTTGVGGSEHPFGGPTRPKVETRPAEWDTEIRRIEQEHARAFAGGDPKAMHLPRSWPEKIIEDCANGRIDEVRTVNADVMAKARAYAGRKDLGWGWGTVMHYLSEQGYAKAARRAASRDSPQAEPAKLTTEDWLLLRDFNKAVGSDDRLNLVHAAGSDLAAAKKWKQQQPANPAERQP